MSTLRTLFNSGVPFYFFFVSDSSLARGAMRAISWLQKRTSLNYRCTIAKDLPEVMTHLQQLHPGGVAPLQALLASMRQPQ